VGAAVAVHVPVGAVVAVRVWIGVLAASNLSAAIAVAVRVALCVAVGAVVHVGMGVRVLIEVDVAARASVAFAVAVRALVSVAVAARVLVALGVAVRLLVGVVVIVRIPAFSSAPGRVASAALACAVPGASEATLAKITSAAAVALGLATILTSGTPTRVCRVAADAAGLAPTIVVASAPDSGASVPGAAVEGMASAVEDAGIVVGVAAGAKVSTSVEAALGVAVLLIAGMGTSVSVGATSGTTAVSSFDSVGATATMRVGRVAPSTITVDCAGRTVVIKGTTRKSMMLVSP